MEAVNYQSFLICIDRQFHQNMLFNNYKASTSYYKIKLLG